MCDDPKSIQEKNAFENVKNEFNIGSIHKLLDRISSNFYNGR